MRRKIKKDLERLSSQSKSLLFSSLAFSFVSPLIGTFMQAYMWRKFDSVESILFMIMIGWIGISAGFISNGFFLQRFSLPKLYGFWTAAQGIALIFVFLLASNSLVQILILGFLMYFCNGCYWCSRLLATNVHTKNIERDLFIGIEMALSMSMSVLSPILFGFVIEGAVSGFQFKPEQKYLFLSIFTALILILSAFNISKSNFHVVKPKSILLIQKNPHWFMLSQVVFMRGFVDGSSSLIPVIITLTQIGKEASLGLVQSFASLFVALIIYFLGSKSTSNARVTQAALAPCLAVIAALSYILFFNPTTTALAAIIYPITFFFGWAALNPLIYELIDHLTGDRPETRCSFLIRREISLALGRIIGTSMIFILFTFSNNLKSYTELLVSISAVLQILLFIIFFDIQKKIQTKKS